ncbi:MAG: lipoate--protein ligase family protein [Actinomycetota bacterium]
MIRLLDFGAVTGLRSQTIWHAVAEAAMPDDPPALCLMTPRDPYISLGFHRSVDEVDLAACAERGFAVYRRRAGGGPVLCDDGQLFFTIVAPAASLPASLDAAWRRAVGPAVDAFRSLGIPASLTADNDIVAGGRKISGLGAARIQDAQVFVGNVIFRFDFAAFAACLALPEPARAQAARLMREHVATVSEAAGREITPDEAAAALVDAYATAFGGVWPDRLLAREYAAMHRLDKRFGDPAWVFAERPVREPSVKIRGGVVLERFGDAWRTVVRDAAGSAAQSRRA